MSRHIEVWYSRGDADDQERGEAEWCGECDERGTFTYACEACS